MNNSKINESSTVCRSRTKNNIGSRCLACRSASMNFNKNLKFLVNYTYGMKKYLLIFNMAFVKVHGCTSAGTSTCRCNITYTANSWTYTLDTYVFFYRLHTHIFTHTHTHIHTHMTHTHKCTHILKAKKKWCRLDRFLDLFCGTDRSLDQFFEYDRSLNLL